MAGLAEMLGCSNWNDGLSEPMRAAGYCRIAVTREANLSSRIGQGAELLPTQSTMSWPVRSKAHQSRLLCRISSSGGSRAGLLLQECTVVCGNASYLVAKSRAGPEV